jgi:hypothetical protein
MKYIKRFNESNSNLIDMENVFLSVFEETLLKNDMKYGIGKEFGKYIITIPGALYHIPMEDLNNLILKFEAKLNKLNFEFSYKEENGTVSLKITNSNIRDEIQNFYNGILKSKIFPSNEYFVYDLDSNEIKPFLNMWFNDSSSKDKIWTVKEVDSTTRYRLYGKSYNPVSISIVTNRMQGISMKAMIHSVDDASYGFWFNDKTKKELLEIRNKLKDWLDDHKILNGEDWMKYGKSIGAEDFDYN